MSVLVLLLSAFLVGVMIGPLVLIGGATAHDGMARWLIKTGIRSGDGWVLNQAGNSYQLVPVDYDAEDAKAYVDSDEERYFEDPQGPMRTLFGRDFGLSVEGTTAISDSLTTAVASQTPDVVADGGELAATDTFSINELQDRLHVGSIDRTETRQTEDGQMVKYQSRIDYINPFVESPEPREIVDIRPVANLLKNAGDSSTPKTTAENAAQAERAFDNWGELKRNASLIAAAMVGGILVYLGMSGGGGGGGGGGASVPGLMIDLAVGGVL
jgi:hypothetical protein